MLKDIQIKVVQARQQRYPTAGDYFEKNGKTIISVVDLGNWKYTSLLLVHELVEYILVKSLFIKLSDIDEFDIAFEEDRERGIHGLHDEPGDDPQAPYYLQHCLATAVERMMAFAMGINWSDYAAIVDNQFVPRPKRKK